MLQKCLSHLFDCHVSLNLFWKFPTHILKWSANQQSHVDIICLVLYSWCDLICNCGDDWPSHENVKCSACNVRMYAHSDNINSHMPTRIHVLHNCDYFLSIRVVMLWNLTLLLLQERQETIYVHNWMQCPLPANDIPARWPNVCGPTVGTSSSTDSFDIWIGSGMLSSIEQSWIMKIVVQVSKWGLNVMFRGQSQDLFLFKQLHSPSQLCYI